MVVVCPDIANEVGISKASRKIETKVVRTSDLVALSEFRDQLNRFVLFFQVHDLVHSFSKPCQFNEKGHSFLGCRELGPTIIPLVDGYVASLE